MEARKAPALKTQIATSLIFGDVPPIRNPCRPQSGNHPSAGPKDEDDFETTEDFKERLTYWLGQMMFVSGETAEPSAETTWMIEEIVREQVLEMVSLPACPC